jgi:preprotein translocase subunit SecE
MGNKRVASKKSQQNKGRFSGAVEFTRNVQGELKRVSWPNRDQLQQSTAVVLIIVLVLMAYVWIWDTIFQRLAELVFL